MDEALRFYGSIFAFELRGSHKDDQGRTAMAFIDMGDQFLALSSGRTQAPDTGRHFGLVVDDRSEVMALAQAAGAKTTEGRPFNFLDPWGNHVEIVGIATFSSRKQARSFTRWALPSTRAMMLGSSLGKRASPPSLS